MATISLCMIVKNEEDTLERCLGCVKDIVDEIILVDTGSTDNTKEIAARFTDKVYDFEWIDDFSAARNASFARATMEYILWLDADDILLPEDAGKLADLKESLTGIDVVMMRYNTGFDRQGRVTFSYFRERLIRRSRGFQWKEPVHEYLEFGGRVVNSDICITHAKIEQDRERPRNVGIYDDLVNAGKELSARGMYYYARELKDCGRYREAIRWFEAFLDSGKGWVEDNICACGELARCYQAENRPAEALAAMLRSFRFDVPRAEICCQVGYYFKALHQYQQAAFWFECVLRLKKPEEHWGFSQEDCWGYIPCLELAVCYDKLNDCERAEAFNNQAALYKPDSQAVLFNKQYFTSRRSGTEEG